MLRSLMLSVLALIVATVPVACDTLVGNNYGDRVGPDFVTADWAIEVTFTREVNIQELTSFSRENKLVLRDNEGYSEPTRISDKDPRRIIIENEWPTWLFDLAPDHEPKPDNLIERQYLDAVANDIRRRNRDLVLEASVIQI